MTLEQKLAALEKLVKQQTTLLVQLQKKISFLERENARRRSDVTLLGQKNVGSN